MVVDLWVWLCLSWCWLLGFWVGIYDVRFVGMGDKYRVDIGVL